MPVGALEKEERLWQDETIYNIMVDRFHNGSSKNDYKVNVQDLSAYNGGDFKGITDKLDYIKEMGFTTISLSPIFDNEPNGYHGNWVKDYYKTEEHFGTKKEFETLVKEAHKRDIKVLIEFVLDSVGPSHPWTKDNSKADWLSESQKINHTNQEVKKYLVDAGKWWIKETNIDGYSINNKNSIPQDFLREFSNEMKSEKKDFFIIEKVSQTEYVENGSYQSSAFDGVTNGVLASPLRDAFSKVDASMETALKITEESVHNSDQLEQFITYLDDETMKRYTRDMVDNKQNPGTRWKLALTYTYTTPGIPSVFYGSEIALDGGDAPDNAKLMGFKADKELIDYMTTLGNLRQQLPALTRGTFELLHHENGMAIYKRTYKNEVIVVAINNTSKTQNITLTSDMLDKNKELRGLLAGDLVREDNGEYKMVIDREEAEIYALTEKTGINMGFIAAIAAVWIIFAIFIYMVMKRSKRKAS